MKIRAVIFDVYGTLLEVGPAPKDADARFQELWKEMLKTEPRVSRLQLSVACNREVARQHALARSRGISNPEIYWPTVIQEVLPEIRTLPETGQAEFIYRQIRTGHSTRFSPNTAEMLRWLKGKRYLLGIASNAQAYTLRELGETMVAQKLSSRLFNRDLCFWSFEHGFSKPDPHVFQILSMRLEARGISPAETLMVGDQLDNDIEPARMHGWHTWQVPSAGGNTDHWDVLMSTLGGSAR